MNLRLLSLAISAIALSAFADVITPEQALARVKNQTQKPLSVGSVSVPKLVKTETAGSQPTVYVFSTENNGYMVLSADDQAEAMLAYGSNFNGEINPSMQWLLGEYSKEIESMRNNPQSQIIKLPIVSTKTTAADKAPISPLLTTKWDQSAPYNNMCPEQNGVRCVSGCVATAMAQVIYYHRVPAGNGIGTASYQWNDQTLTFDFANNSFDWENMLDVYTSSATQTQQDAVAKLMYACGVSVSMGYNAYGSGAYSEDIPMAMIEYFGFDKNVHMEERMFYTAQGWNDFIYSQLTDYGPVMLSGTNTSIGHMFVCDGYSSDGFFHINWGWSGVSDGYFKLSALDPDSQGIGGSTSGYNANLCAVANVKAPVNGSSYFVEVTCSNKFYPEVTSTTLGQNFNVNGEFYNTGTADMVCSLGYILENTVTSQTTIIPQYSNVTLKVGYGSEQLTFNIPTTTAEGVYKLYPAWKIEGSEWKKMRVNSIYMDHFTLSITGSNVNFAVGDGAQISVLDFELPMPLIYGYEANLECNIQNISEHDYYGPIFAVVLTPNTYDAVGSGLFNTVEINAGQNKTCTYKSHLMSVDGGSMPPGEYDLLFADQNGYVISNNVTRVEVVEVPETMGSLSVSSIEFVGDSNNADKNNLEFEATITSTGGAFIGQLRLWIFKIQNQGYYLIEVLDDPLIYIGDGETDVKTFKGALPSLTEGQQYCGAVYQSSNQLSDFAYFTVGNTSGIEEIEADSQIVSRQYFTASGMEVKKENLTPGIYIVIERTVSGKTIATKKFIH